MDRYFFRVLAPVPPDVTDASDAVADLVAPHGHLLDRTAIEISDRADRTTLGQVLDPAFRWPDGWTPALWVNHAGAILWCPVPAGLPLPSELRLILDAWINGTPDTMAYTRDWQIVPATVAVASRAATRNLRLPVLEPTPQPQSPSPGPSSAR